MSDTITTIEDAAAHLPELVERVYAHRQPALILRAGTPVARIVPVTGQTEPSMRYQVVFHRTDEGISVSVPALSGR